MTLNLWNILSVSQRTEFDLKQKENHLLEVMDSLLSARCSSDPLTGMNYLKTSEHGQNVKLDLKSSFCVSFTPKRRSVMFRKRVGVERCPVSDSIVHLAPNCIAETHTYNSVTAPAC